MKKLIYTLGVSVALLAILTVCCTKTEIINGPMVKSLVDTTVNMQYDSIPPAETVDEIDTTQHPITFDVTIICWEIVDIDEIEM